MWSKQECSWAQAVRIMWDKNVTGENESKWKCKEVTKCEICGVHTSQRHMIVECQRPGAAAIRATAIQKVRQEGDKHGNNLIGKTIRAVLRLRDHADAYTLWTGLWTPEIRTEVAASCPWTLTRREYSKVVAALRHLADGVLELYKQGGRRAMKRVRSGGPKRESRQASMDEFTQRMDDLKDDSDDVHEEGLDNAQFKECRELDERVHGSRKYDRRQK